MKFTQAFSVIILTASISAAALPEARCGRIGQPCKRAAEAVADALANPRCGRIGQPCKRDVAEADLDDIVARLVTTDDDFFEKVKREVIAISKREAAPEPEPEPEPEARCGRIGQPC